MQHKFKLTAGPDGFNAIEYYLWRRERFLFWHMWRLVDSYSTEASARNASKEYNKYPIYWS